MSFVWNETNKYSSDADSFTAGYKETCEAAQLQELLLMAVPEDLQVKCVKECVRW